MVDPPTREVFKQAGQMATVIMPLYLQDRWVGLALCQWDKPRQFTAQDKRIYTALGSQLAAVVDAVRSSEALEVAQKEAELLYSVASRLNGAKTRHDLLSVVSDYAFSRGSVSAALLYIDVDDNGVPESMEFMAEIRQSGVGEPVGGRYKLSDFPFARLWLSSPEKPILLDDVTTSKLVDETTRSLFVQGGTKATVLMPLYLQGRWIGMVTCTWEKVQAFTEQDQRLYTAIGVQLAAVVDAVRSNEALAESQRETEQRAIELETVAEVSTTAASVLDIDALLQTVVDLTKSRFNLYHAHIYLYDADQKNLVLSAGAGEAGHQMNAEGRPRAP